MLSNTSDFLEMEFGRFLATFCDMIAYIGNLGVEGEGIEEWRDGGQLMCLTPAY
jgi:hypothetical protein